jgi:hypothetical protein
MQVKRHQDMNERQYKAELAEQKRGKPKGFNA